VVRPNAGTKGVPRLDRETQILDIASEQFGTHGFAATSVATIADKAGISKPLIYNYFGSKEGLYEACLDRGGALLADEIERIARGDAVGIERGMATLAGMFTLLEPQPYLWRLFFDQTAPSTGPIADSVALYAERIGKLADEGVTELMTLAGNTDPLDISAMTAVWLGIVDSLMNWWMEHPDESAEQMMQRCLRLLAALFGGEPA
jgi:AcrR family transcriptional regulator